MIKFVRVKFKNSSKLYDYICELDNVQKGDYVYVCTRDGMEKVEVCGLFYSELKDMPLHESAYKKVEGLCRRTSFGPYAKGTRSKRKRNPYDRRYSASSNNASGDGCDSGQPSRLDTMYDDVGKEETPADDPRAWKNLTLKDKIATIFIYALFAFYFVVFIWSFVTEEGAQARAMLHDFNDFAPRR